MAAAAGAGPPPLQVSQYIVKEGKEEIEARINELNVETNPVKRAEWGPLDSEYILETYRVVEDIKALENEKKERKAAAESLSQVGNSQIEVDGELVDRLEYLESIVKLRNILLAAINKRKILSQSASEGGQREAKRSKSKRSKSKRSKSKRSKSKRSK
jgi:hypothetical protein